VCFVLAGCCKLTVVDSVLTERHSDYNTDRQYMTGQQTRGNFLRYNVIFYFVHLV